MSIRENWDGIQQTIAGITGQPVTVVAVTKLRSPAEIREVIAAGATVLGENRVEEAYTKFIEEGLRAEYPGVALHMIGHLQSRKARVAVELFDCIQSVDSLKLAVEIDKRCQPLNKTMDIMLEVNVSGESQKYGLHLSEAGSIISKVIELPRLRLKGLMTMAPFTDDEAVLRETFSGLRLLRDQLAHEYGRDYFTELSMGMTNDYTIAVEEGSSMVRIGTALFKMGDG
jgi:pyridoxal phosphate enzyme (YggS family)